MSGNGSEFHGVVDSWRAACAGYPDRIAIEDGAVQWTYRELGRRADAWASKIDESRAGANVAIQLPHCADAIAALLGIISSGRCYIPLDRTEPVSRRLARLQFSGSTLLLSQQEDAADLCGGWNGRIISSRDVSEKDDAPDAMIDPAVRAYLHFTSGSSGEPKAIAGLHRTVGCGVAHLQAMLGFTPEDHHALLSRLGIPASLAQIFAVLTAGAQLHLFDARSQSLSATVDWLNHRKITTLQLVPSLFRAIARQALETAHFKTVRAVKLGGETVMAADARLFAKCASKGAVLVNGLGLTEAGFNVCWWKWHPGENIPGDSLPIGSPPASLDLVIETSPGTLASDGQVGEIVVRSPSLPEGYWRNPELSAEIYRDLPERLGWRELRTRDAGSWRGDGLIEHKGRLDELVKIRGYRVAPSEVEAALSDIDGVAEAAVVTMKEGDMTRLHAFVQAQSTASLKLEDMRRQLGTKLPVQMMPAHIYLVDSLPRLTNGKIDRIELSKKSVSGPGRAARSDPADPVFSKLLFVWQEILGSREIGMNDDFFASGGDSLSAMTMLTTIEKSFGVRIQIADWLKEPTIQGLGHLIGRSAPGKGNLPLVALRREGKRPPLFCVPSSGSNAFEFRLLASQIEQEQPLFSFEFPGIDGQTCCPNSVEELTELYFKAVRTEQPCGPYHLCGTSFGGSIALEIARRLLLQGEEVRFLGLLDSRGPGYPKPRKNLRVRGRIKLALLPLLPRFERSSFTLWMFRKGLKDRSRRWLLRRYIQVDSLFGRRVSPCPARWRELYAQEVSFAATRRYQPAPFPGKIHLFRAEHQPPADLFEEDPLLGWKDLAAGGIEVHSLPGHHNMYLRDPSIVAVLAKELAACLDRKVEALEKGQFRN